MTHHSDVRPSRPRHGREPTPETGLSYADRHGPGDLEATPAYAVAVAEAEAVFAARWPRWVADHGLDPVPTLRRERPRVSAVGTDPADTEVVAALAFAFDSGGRTFHGLARGPAGAPLFWVRLALEPVADPRRSRWPWRRARSVPSPDGGPRRP